MQAGPDFDLQLRGLVGYRARAADRSRGPVEARDEAVPRLLDLPTSEALQLRADERVVPLQQRAPSSVAQLGRVFRRVDDVGEQDGREDPVGGPAGACAGEKF